MKTSIAVLFFVCALFSAKAQDKNDLLYEAIIKSDKAAVEFQLAAGANPNYVKELSAWARISMVIAAVDHNNVEILKMLLDRKANVDFRDGFNTTAIIYAASNGELEMVKLLVASGANVNDNDGQGNSVLSAAKDSENAELVAFVVSKGAK